LGSARRGHFFNVPSKTHPRRDKSPRGFREVTSRVASNRIAVMRCLLISVMFKPPRRARRMRRQPHRVENARVRARSFHELKRQAHGMRAACLLDQCPQELFEELPCMRTGVLKALREVKSHKISSPLIRIVNASRIPPAAGMAAEAYKGSARSMSSWVISELTTWNAC